MKRFFYLLLLICCRSFFLFGNDNAPVQSIAGYSSQISANSKTYLYEKVYLHIDNTAYFLGETIWFKAYVVQSGRNALCPLSKTLYVELLTLDGNVVETKKLKLENGCCHGEFVLPETQFPGFYEIRAYTRHMLNEDMNGLFSRVIPCYDNPGKKNTYSFGKMRLRARSKRVPGPRVDYSQKGKLQVSFFPEGGHLVAGLTSRVGFQAFGKDGEDAVVTGVICSETGDTVSSFTTSFMNMGSFMITPQVGKYSADVTYDGKEYRFPLPEILPEGCVLGVETLDQEVFKILIQQSDGLMEEPLGLSITCRGVLYGGDNFTLGDEHLLYLSFPKRLLPSGVSQITLYNTKGEVLAERMVFVNHNSSMKVDVQSSKRKKSPYENVTMDISLCDSKNQPVETTFSVSVRDASTTPVTANTDNILTNLLLSSELKGYIKNPGYYFEEDSPERRADLDLLLLTQGWSRYSWKRMAGLDTTPEKHPIENGLLIEGNVYSLKKNRPKTNVNVLMMLLTDSTSQQGTCKTDSDGRFNLALIDFYGKSNLTIETKEDSKRTDNRILLDRVFSPGVKTYAWHEQQLPAIDAVVDTLDAVSDVIIGDTFAVSQPEPSMDGKDVRLPEVEVKARKNIQRETDGLRRANVVLDVEKSIDQLLDKGEDIPVTGLDFICKMWPYFKYRFEEEMDDEDESRVGTHVKCTYKGHKTILVLNNRLVNIIDEHSLVINLRPEDIKLVTVCEEEGPSVQYSDEKEMAFFLNNKKKKVFFSGEENIIYIYTYQDLHDRTSPEGIRQTSFDGYAQTKEFYSPQYDNSSLPDIADCRRTLYWNPEVKTGKDGKAIISFYNNGSCNVMNVSLETVTDKGLIGTYQSNQ